MDEEVFTYTNIGDGILGDISSIEEISELKKSASMHSRGTCVQPFPDYLWSYSDKHSWHMVYTMVYFYLPQASTP